MKVLITGAAGFIGGHLCRELEQYNHEVIRTDIRFPGYPGSFKSYLDCRPKLIGPSDMESALIREKPDIVIHLAAKVGRLFGEDNIQETISDNCGMTAHVAKLCGEHGVRLMYASTSEVYGDWDYHICLEDDPFTRIPHNTYGLTKRHGEEFCKLYAPENLTIMRFSMPYGPGLPAGRGRAALINFIYSALHLESIIVHKGSERSWCWIGDTVRGVRILLEGNHSGAFNIGRDDNARTMREVAEMCCDITGAPYDLIQEVNPPERQTVVKRLATNKIRDLGWEPEVTLEEGIERTYEWVARTYPLPVSA